MLVSRIWAGEDLNENDIGVCFIDGKIDELAHKDTAF